MLHSKFRGNRLTGSGEGDFEGFSPYIGVVCILVMWPRCRVKTLVPPTHRRSTQNLALIGQAVSEMFEHCERR